MRKQSDIEIFGNAIFDNIYPVSVSHRDMQTDFQLKNFGMPTSGDDVLDKQMHGEMVDTYMTINQIVEYFKAGVVITVRDREDTKRIYDIVSGYMTAWATALETGLNIGGAPVDDLVLLDRFAGTVFPYAQEFVRPENKLSRFIHQTMGPAITRESLIAATPTAAEEERSRSPLQRESLADLFASRVRGVF